MKVLRTTNQMIAAAGHQRDGAAAVEFAVMLPLFVMLILGTIELGAGLRASQVMLSAVRSGARFASMDWTDKLAAGQTPNEKVVDDIQKFLRASGVDVENAEITITHADGSNAGQEFDLTDKDNDLELFEIALTIPFEDVNAFPNNYLGMSSLRQSLTQRAGQANFEN